jgi:preprotein translocase subunit YajC
MLEFLSAGTASAGAQSGWIGMLPLLGIVVIFWFLIIRPQMKQQKDQRAKIAAVKKGDMIITAGGKLGKVTKVDDPYLEVEIAQGVRVKVVRSTIADIVPPGGTPAND